MPERRLTPKPDTGCDRPRHLSNLEPTHDLKPTPEQTLDPETNLDHDMSLPISLVQVGPSQACPQPHSLTPIASSLAATLAPIAQEWSPPTSEHIMTWKHFLPYFHKAYAQPASRGAPLLQHGPNPNPNPNPDHDHNPKTNTSLRPSSSSSSPPCGPSPD